ncbi:hypothetical protein MICCA_260011 [Microcystis aeruginosa PCC 9432]|uniref:Uncharacterized protein n=1 Tax=Microcystis aeruginosa PCC 9432 TaxID=1160280 RepID=A0A822L8L8_MICAE|nr:hypothetical protein MICCA_260011 [Microcystis aeruginosa PCC 9432]
MFSLKLNVLACRDTVSPNKVNTAVMYITLVFINVSPQSASAPPRSQIKQQPNTKGGQNKNTHSPPPQLY